jgi:class 3 adenylate cyclase
MPPVRRLTAILAADVAGYSRLMGADEEGTHERLKAHLAQLVEPKIKEHRGHTVKNTGDGLLAEFPSVVDAVRCAVEVQRGMAERNAETPEDKRLTFRIGVNLGDVIVEEHDIFGDGVNVAARLEALADPGGVFVSIRSVSTSATACRSPLRIWASTRSKTSPDLCGCTGFTIVQCPASNQRRPRDSRCLSLTSRRSPCCRSRI